MALFLLRTNIESKLLRVEQIYDYELRKLLDSYKFVLDEKSLIS